jgi:hypothetical protein
MLQDSEQHIKFCRKPFSTYHPTAKLSFKWKDEIKTLPESLKKVTTEPFLQSYCRSDPETPASKPKKRKTDSSTGKREREVPK